MYPYEWTLITIITAFPIECGYSSVAKSKASVISSLLPQCCQTHLGLTGPDGLHCFLFCMIIRLLCYSLPTLTAADFALKTGMRGWDEFPFIFGLGFIRGLLMKGNMCPHSS